MYYCSKECQQESWGELHSRTCPRTPALSRDIILAKKRVLAIHMELVWGTKTGEYGMHPWDGTLWLPLDDDETRAILAREATFQYPADAWFEYQLSTAKRAAFKASELEAMNNVHCAMCHKRLETLTHWSHHSVLHGQLPVTELRVKAAMILVCGDAHCYAQADATLREGTQVKFEEGVHACARCNVMPLPSQRFKWCSRCKSVCYCGPDCQKLAWPMHKIHCVKKEV